MQLGIIIREETVVKGENYKNGIIPIISEKERVAKNQAIFRYMANDEENLKKKIEQIDLKVQDALSGQSAIFPTDIKNLEKQIDDKIKKINTLTDLQKISEYKKYISEVVTKKAKIIGELSASGSYIKELTEEKEKYETELTEGSEYIKAPIAGLVSYRVDGLENTLSPDNLDELTQERLESLGLKTGKIIPISNEEAKVINNFNIRIASILNSESAKNAKVGDKVKIMLSGGSEIDAEIEHINLTAENEKVVVIFKLNVMSDELIEYRKISFNITWWSKSGIKIANDAIVEDAEGKKYVVKEKAGIYSKVLVNVLKKNDKYSIVENYTAEDYEKQGIDASLYGKISQYDMVLMYPDLEKISR